MYGLLVGDALGVPYEFHVPQNLPPPDQIELEPPPEFRRSHWEQPPGTWSDDGSQALVLLGSLLDRGELDLDDLGARLVRWWAEGLGWVDRPFDIGNQTSDALLALEAGVPAHRSGPAGERDNGNGSLMRVLPLALWHRGSDAELARDAARQSLPTHGHPRSQLCCALYCLWARRIAERAPDPWQAAVDAIEAIGLHPEELDKVLAFDRPRGSGYVVDTLHVARIALAAGSYEQVVKRAIAFGLDTDTTAAVAGGLAGLRDGVEAIPERWRAGLRGVEQVEPLLARLAARLETQ
ncbi:MAG: ADP-ribosylglycohydrolase family protein [Myxococcota bacterium]